MAPKRSVSLLAGIALGIGVAAGAVGAKAAELDERELQVVGTWSSLSQWRNFESPFWKETLPAASKGAVTANARPMDEMGLTGFELMRQLKLGAFDVVHTLVVYSASDVPLASGVDLAGLVRDRESYQKMIDAYRPVLEKEFERAYGAKILALYSFSSYSMLCSLEESAQGAGLEGLAGLKVRSHSTPMGDFIEGLGGTAVTLPFGEVVPSLQQGVVDCGVTGVLSAYQAKWWQVTNSYLDIPLGFGTVVVAANLDTWNELSPETQAFVAAEVAKLETKISAASAAEDDLGFACYGAGPCAEGDPGQNKAIALSAADVAKVESIVEDFVLRRFAERCGADCAKTWNDTVGAALGVKAGD